VTPKPATKKEKPRVATSTTDGALGSAHTESNKPKKAMNSSRAKKCPRCDESFAGVATSSRRDNKTNICKKCGTTEGMLDNQPMMKIPTTLLFEEEKFQTKLGLDYYAWLKTKREREMTNG
jgi:ribosomal protein L40E